jgi:hypothetical protein
MGRQVPGKARWAGRLFAVVLLAGACGCGGTATVTGKVRYQGRPVTYGSVIFLSADKTARSGVIGPDGSYTVEGVEPGDVKIGVISRDPSKARKHVGTGSKAAAPVKPAARSWFPLPRKLEDPATSGLSCTVGAGHIRHDIDL